MLQPHTVSSVATTLQLQHSWSCNLAVVSLKPRCWDLLHAILHVACPLQALHGTRVGSCSYRSQLLTHKVCHGL
jgi:hypothetical protein